MIILYFSILNGSKYEYDEAHALLFGRWSYIWRQNENEGKNIFGEKF